MNGLCVWVGVVLVWVGLLGPFEAAGDAHGAVRLPARLRVLLAALALSAGKPVAGDALAEFVWDGAPPSGYAATGGGARPRTGAGDLPPARQPQRRGQHPDRPGAGAALTGDFPAAAHAQELALEIYRRTGNRNGEAWALNHYAATVAATGDRPRALALYHQALAMNRELNKPDDEAISLEGIGEHHLATGDTDRGADHLRQALEIYQHLGMTPDVERVRARLAGLATG